MADSMFIRVPVAVRAKVTEDLKTKIVTDLENTIKNINMDLQQFEIQAKQIMAQAANDLSMAGQVREQVEARRAQINAAKGEHEERLKQAQELKIGTEITYGNPLERTVEVKVGDDLQALMGAEIVVEDGKIIAFRM